MTSHSFSTSSPVVPLHKNGLSMIAQVNFLEIEWVLEAKHLGASSEVHFPDIPPDELLRRLAQRNAQPSKFSFRIPEEMMIPWIAFFQKPTLDERERRA